MARSQKLHSRRRVSVVIFLNRQSQEPAEDAYGEGHLTFYGLLEGREWEKCAFPLDAEPGLLIAFPSDKWHEVKPVSHGRRFTVVTWFHAPETQTVVERAAGARILRNRRNHPVGRECNCRAVGTATIPCPEVRQSLFRRRSRLHND